MRSIVTAICILLACVPQLFAQESIPVAPTEPLRLPEAGESKKDEIETDRDSFTPAVTTAGKGRFILESGWSFIDNRGRKETNSFPETILRYGLTDRLELRLGWNYEVGGASGETSGAEILSAEGNSTLKRESTLSYGLKYRLTQQDVWLPASSLIVQGLTPTNGKAADTMIVGTYIFGWELPNRIKLDVSMRYGTGTENSNRFNEWAPSVVLKAPIGERFSAHIEYFGIFSRGKEEEIQHQYISPGLHYLITENLEIGVRVGFGLNEQTPRFFSNVGIGYRY